jgi:hypothetical protein
MSNCHDFGIGSGCQPHCPVLREGKCEQQREMVVTYIFSGEWDIEEGSPCVEEGCCGNYQFVERSPCHPAGGEIVLECSECCEPAPSKEDIRERGQSYINDTFSLGPLLDAAAKNGAAPDISTDKRIRKPVAAEEPVSLPSVAKELLPIHRAISQTRTQSPVRPWVPFWLGQD